MAPTSRFIATTDLMKESTPFPIVNDPSAPNFRPDPSAQTQLDAMDAQRAAEKEQEIEEEKEALFHAYFDTGRTNEAVLAGPISEITGKALLQLRVTMTTQEVLDEIEARHGADSVKTNTLQRRYGDAFDKAAAAEDVEVNTMKEAFNKVSSVSKARKTWWRRPDAEGSRKDSTSTSKSTASGSKGKKKA